MTGMISLGKTRKVGGSLIVTIPKEIVELEDIRKDDTIELSVRKVKKSYRGILRGLGPFKKGDKLDIHEDYT